MAKKPVDRIVSDNKRVPSADLPARQSSATKAAPRKQAAARAPASASRRRVTAPIPLDEAAHLIHRLNEPEHASALQRKLEARKINASNRSVRIDRKTFEAIQEVVRESPGLQADTKVLAAIKSASFNGDVGFGGKDPGRQNAPPPGQPGGFSGNIGFGGADPGRSNPDDRPR